MNKYDLVEKIANEEEIEFAAWLALVAKLAVKALPAIVA